MKLHTEKSTVLPFSMALLLGILGMNVALPATAADYTNPHDVDNMYVWWGDDDSKDREAVTRGMERVEEGRQEMERRRREDAKYNCRGSL